MCQPPGVGWRDAAAHVSQSDLAFVETKREQEMSQGSEHAARCGAEGKALPA